MKAFEVNNMSSDKLILNFNNYVKDRYYNKNYILNEDINGLLNMSKYVNKLNYQGAF